MKRKKYALTGILFILPSFAGVCFFVLVPFLDVTLRSFQSAVTRGWTGLENYKTLFQTPAFWLAAKNTLRFTGICIPLLVCLSLFISVFLHRQGILGSFLKSAFLLPMAVPVASVVLLWRVVFHAEGYLSIMIEKMGQTPADWMNSKYAFWILVFSYIWKNLGYDIVLWMAGLSGVPYSLYEAARTDGAGAWICFWKITLPNLKPVLYTITVLSFLNSFKVFREGYLAAGDYPDESMYLLQHLFNNWFREMDFDKLAAAAVLMVLVIIVFVFLLQRAWNCEE